MFNSTCLKGRLDSRVVFTLNLEHRYAALCAFAASIGLNYNSYFFHDYILFVNLQRLKWRLWSRRTILGLFFMQRIMMLLTSLMIKFYDIIIPMAQASSAWWDERERFKDSFNFVRKWSIATGIGYLDRSFKWQDSFEPATCILLCPIYFIFSTDILIAYVEGNILQSTTLLTFPIS